MRAKGFKRAIPAIIILLFCSIIGIAIHIFSANGETLYISHESGIYSGSFDLRVFSFRKADIYYTLNGQEPQPGAEGTYEYEGPISVECGNGTSTLSVQLFCLYRSGSRSEVYRRDFIMDPLGEERFTTDYVVSVTGNEDELFSDEKGIFVRGDQFEEYLLEHPETDLLNEIVPANYYSDVEVPVHAAIFLKDGTQIIDQNCGLKIYGSVQRAQNQKSFRLYARYEYDQTNQFSYPFFDDICTYDGKEPITSCQRLSFHNSGNDNDNGYIRTALIGRLARQSGFYDTLGAESVTVYVNGRYMGVYWLQNAYDDKYFKERYGKYEGEMVVAAGSLGSMDMSETENEYEEQLVKDYNSFCEWLATADVSNESDWNRICNTVDIDNFAHYFALEYYSGNLDWPSNNVKIYRYVCADEEGYIENSVFDGRYRFLLFDTDYSMGLHMFGTFGYDATKKRLNEFINYSDHTILFKILIQREEFRNLFVSKTMMLMNEFFIRQNVSDQMYELNVTRHIELKYMVEESGILKGSIWEPWGVGCSDMSKTEQNWNQILVYAEQRPQYVIEELQTEFGYEDVIVLNVYAEENIVLVINDMKIDNQFEGVWFREVPIKISCNVCWGQTVKGYTVNGTFIEGEQLQINLADYAKFGGDITIIPVIENEEQEHLTVASYSIGDSQDYVVLQNDGTVSLNLNDYALADGEESLSGSSLPSVRLEPGEKFYVYGAKYTGNMEQNSTQVAFSWNDEEQIYLYGDTIGMQVY